MAGDKAMIPAASDIAFATMVGDEPVFLPIWINYYARIVPKAQLFILVDGLHRVIPPEAEGCQVIRLPGVAPGPGWDVARWRMISLFTNTLLQRFGVVVFNDVDEILLADPAAGGGLLDHIGRAREVGVISPFAIEMLHRMDLEPDPFDPARPVLAQRRFGRINASYCKPCITARPINWSIGGYYSDCPTLNLDPALFLFHLRFLDHAMLRARQASRQVMMQPGAAKGAEVAGAGWLKGAQDMTDFLQSFVDAGPPLETDFSFGWQRKRIIDSWHHDAEAGIWRHDRLHNRKTYRLPDRMADQF
jgi:hypothetical protein